jgi:hypothetical protein
MKPDGFAPETGPIPGFSRMAVEHHDLASERSEQKARVELFLERIKSGLEAGEFRISQRFEQQEITQFVQDLNAYFKRESARSNGPWRQRGDPVGADPAELRGIWVTSVRGMSSPATPSSTEP